ncbi:MULTISPECIES: ABC transporter ATP-binding protein [unclassified Ruminococcus]|uniref:ABC transporter ATP-binding protein n=1 Tax=unclassified Ruminococcus TaxID=2608920 RepID=UPI00210A09B0|nr:MULTISPECIES: ABC transporter ATP-binding protein [unclassified Ruminococcus]MCQ4021589.1 ATP-binding cassette domain-containing protein [Ruminococcus sp. zg-924]MCQ4114034.1 ATP-binding cassette domain-containing protein [Ruminococcus sp. zg-921]
MIKVENLIKTYKLGKNLFYALDDVSFTINDGEFVAICGTSGAGKSTLLHILGCLDKADSGKYYIDGVDVFSLNDSKTSKLRNQKIGFVLQDFSLINQKKVDFNVMLPMYFNKTSGSQMKIKADKALKAVGLDEQQNKNVNQLSGGQRQRVAIARAIVNSPSVIFADEPTGSLDSKTSQSIMELFKELNDKGITVIIVTHDKEIAAHCNRLIEMKDGKIVFDSKNS